MSIVIQVQWLTHAPIARAAQVYYAGQFNPNSIFNIDFLAMSYMLFSIIFILPASYVIGTYGIKVGVSFGAVLAGIAALVKGIFGANFVIVLIAQIALAISQSFIINAATAITARWFPLKERGLATGFATLAQYLGIILVMAITPLLVVSSPEDPLYGQGIDKMLLIYGVITFVVSIITIIFLKEAPPTPPSEQEYKPTKFTQGLKHILHVRDMKITLLLFFIGLGIFNAVSSMVDALTGYIGVSDSDGLIGVFMLVGGVIGAVIIPILSDKYMKRKLFLVICIAGMVPGMFGLTFAGALFGNSAYLVALISSFILGFFVMSAGPIGFQYAAEISAPAPEATSQGLLLLSGQITGMLFVGAMSIKDNIFLGPSMIIFFILSIVAFLFVLTLKESPMMLAEIEKQKNN
jgi:MFS family permease